MSRVNLVFIICLMFVFAGCSKKELEKLHNENQQLSSDKQQLESKVQTLEQEIAKLKETADYHYQQGSDFMSSEKYEEAKSEFETVIEKYPTSPLVSSAKQQLIKAKRELVKFEAQRIAEEKRLEAQRQAEEKLNGEPIDYATFYSKYGSKTIETYKRYRFSAWIQVGVRASLYLYSDNSRNQQIATENNFDDISQLEDFLKQKNERDVFKTVVVSVGDYNRVRIHKME